MSARVKLKEGASVIILSSNSPEETSQLSNCAQLNDLSSLM